MVIPWREANRFVIPRSEATWVWAFEFAAISVEAIETDELPIKECTDCVCSGGHCAAVGGFAALRMRRPLYGE